ncbi:hypothetical protein AWR27_07880 [Spirosoma montaniterrae]|uniref:HTH araC/xylS-type domain-containing protein n=2 Tax=Spirosoma montaniterrae TaxID=1178516 RepID=A0A1P9WV52_9BACT|nr:hypothetical protein AWR27_07880 [Spirosoma montaniterrae]
MQNPTGWHSHPEIELLWVVSGSGTRFVGDSIEPFQEQELVLLGENLPHSWQAENLTDERPEAVVIQFQRTFLGNEFFQTPEFAHIDRLLDRADRGLLFSGETLSPVTALLTQLPTQSALEQVFTILRVLDRLSTIDAYRTLARPSFSADYHRSTDGRIDRVYEFTIAQFGQNITLRQAAEVAGLTEASFCRYFKLHTRRTYVEFLNEIRVGYACKLLITTNRDITQICYECGFLTLSNFNRRFKRVTGLTPTHYRERISQNQG